jgi:hypothetical protein
MNHPLPVTPETTAGIAVTLASITGWLSDKDWERMIGPWGGMMISVVMLGILLRHSAKRITKEDERAKTDREERERRHSESLAAMRETHGKFEQLHTRAMDTQLETAKALLKLSHASEKLHDEMRGRPCQTMRRELPPMPAMTDPMP